jgi:hypothetical protein
MRGNIEQRGRSSQASDHRKDRRYGTVIRKTCPRPLGGGPKPTLET